ncbi:hypothetical protein MP228_000011 [Amoeboaphelidium protococcarum]|nr:hypothetical protein MP228_000011 [Amoeboaphelidium protococcarum]
MPSSLKKTYNIDGLEHLTLVDTQPQPRSDNVHERIQRRVPLDLKVAGLVDLRLGRLNIMQVAHKIGVSGDAIRAHVKNADKYLQRYREVAKDEETGDETQIPRQRLDSDCSVQSTESPARAFTSSTLSATKSLAFDGRAIALQLFDNLNGVDADGELGKFSAVLVSFRRSSEDNTGVGVIGSAQQNTQQQYLQQQENQVEVMKKNGQEKKLQTKDVVKKAAAAVSGSKRSSDSVDDGKTDKSKRRRDHSSSIQPKGQAEDAGASSVQIVSSINYVAKHLDEFFPKGSDIKVLDAVEKVELLYPSGTFETFPLISPLKDGYSPLVDLVKTIELLAYDFIEDLGDPADAFSDKIYRRIERAVKKRDFTLLKQLISEYNEIITDMRSHDKFEAFNDKPLSYNQTKIFLDQIYARAVDNPDALRSYKGFSKEVYGETGNNIVNTLIETLPIKKDNIFIDLGSGIGNVALQVTAQTKAKCYGVELMEQPALYGKMQLHVFKERMKMYGRDDFHVYLRKGDFLGDQKVLKVIECADVVFVNNYAFDQETNLKLMQLFLHLKEGAFVVSFRPFRSLDHVIADHNINDMASIFKVKKMDYGPNSVSWTGNSGEYFIHQVDRRYLKAKSAEAN